jgi:hypothetical protein
MKVPPVLLHRHPILCRRFLGKKEQSVRHSLLALSSFPSISNISTTHGFPRLTCSLHPLTVRLAFRRLDGRAGREDQDRVDLSPKPPPVSFLLFHTCRGRKSLLALSYPCTDEFRCVQNDISALDRNRFPVNIFMRIIVALRRK